MEEGWWILALMLGAVLVPGEAWETQDKVETLEATTVQPLADSSAGSLDEARGAEARGAKPEPAVEIADALLRASGFSDTNGNSALTRLVARNYKKMAQTILPLLVGFKATGMLVIAIAVTKFILLKALFLSTTALLVAALLALKKFLTSMGQPHDVPAVYTYQHQDLSHVPYLHAHTGSEYMEAAQAAQVPQVTFIGGSYGLQSIPYGATAAAGIAGVDDAQGLYSTHNGVTALSQLQQLQQLQQQALLAQQLAGNATQQQQQQQHQAGQLLQLSRRKLNAHQGASVSSPYPYRPTRAEARPA